MDPSVESTCTTCTYSKDFSNYWTASLYFRSPENGSYKLVPQRYNFVGIDGAQQPMGGGLTLYYMMPFGGGGKPEKVVAFKPVNSLPPLSFFSLSFPPFYFRYLAPSPSGFF